MKRGQCGRCGQPVTLVTGFRVGFGVVDMWKHDHYDPSNQHTVFGAYNVTPV